MIGLSARTPHAETAQGAADIVASINPPPARTDAKSHNRQPQANAKLSNIPHWHGQFRLTLQHAASDGSQFWGRRINRDREPAKRGRGAKSRVRPSRTIPRSVRRGAMLGIAVSLLVLTAAPAHAQTFDGTPQNSAPPSTSATPPTEAAPGTPPADSPNTGRNANDGAGEGGDRPATAAAQLDLRELVRAGGVIGLVIAGLSVAMVALIVEHLFSIRRRALMPNGLAESLHQRVSLGRFVEARELCKAQPSFLAHVVDAGIAEADLGYAAMEKAMEDAATEQTARLFRKIEYLQVIGTLAPMLGLLGTVWGMILAFLEFESKANPQVSELAPGIYRALVTTLFGLGVAVPALAAYAIFRNRIDELAAEATLTAEQIFADFKRLLAKRRAGKKTAAESHTPQASAPAAPRPPVAAPTQGNAGS